MAGLRLIESAAAESGEVRPFASERADCSSCRSTASGESTRFKANQQRLFREYRRDQSTSNGENRGELSKGEANNSVRRAVFFHRQGEIRDPPISKQDIQIIR